MAGLTLKQQRFADEYIIRTQIMACVELSKRYLTIRECITVELIEECAETIKSVSASSIQKHAAKTILNIKFGSEKANSLIEPFAIVKDRSDPLVNRWAKQIKKRDKVCQLCESEEKLEAHHISHWVDDIVNRINPDNGILLCGQCHSLMHPDLPKGLFGGAKHEREA